MPILHVDLAAGYGTNTVLHALRFDLHAGEALGLVGASGAGKSTLAMAMLGLLGWKGGWVRGQVLLDGQNLLALPEREARGLRGRTIALIPQAPLSALNGAVSLRRHFEEAWRAHASSGRPALAERLRTLLPELQLPADAAFLARRPGEISVGQAQRVVVALALLHRPAVLLADEPTSALDPITQAELLKLLGSLVQPPGAGTADRGTALIYISHDLLSVLQLCDRVAVLEGGTLVQTLPVDDLRQDAAHPALGRLLDALPADPDAVLARRQRRGVAPVLGHATRKV